MRTFMLSLALVLVLPLSAEAVDAPAAQTHLDSGHVLRGQFTDDKQVPGLNGPMRTTGHFVAAPAQGLIWGIEQPFVTSTIVTPTGAIQSIGGMALKLPAKNLRHLYDLVGSALAGRWNALESDFVITPSTTAQGWQMLLTPRDTDNGKLPYATIAITGHQFVEQIVLTKKDESRETLSLPKRPYHLCRSRHVRRVLLPYPANPARGQPSL